MSDLRQQFSTHQKLSRISDAVRELVDIVDGLETRLQRLEEKLAASNVEEGGAHQ